MRNFPNPQILVIDDDDVVATHVSAVLRQSLDASVETYLDPRKALDRILSTQRDGESIDAIVCDIQMPNLSGYDLLLELRSAQIDIPVVFLSGKLDAVVLSNVIRLKAFDVAQKPPILNQLSNTVGMAARVGQSMRRSRDLLQNIQSILKFAGPSPETLASMSSALQEIRDIDHEIGRIGLMNHARKVG